MKALCIFYITDYKKYQLNRLITKRAYDINIKPYNF